MIESLTNQKIKYAMKLKKKKNRTQTKQFLVEGEHLVEEAMKSNLIDTLFMTEKKAYSNVNMYLVSNEVFKKLSHLNMDKGVIAICNKPSMHSLSNKVLILDGIQDPGNMGTLIRSAAAFGFKTVISEDAVDYYNEKVIRSSQGAIFYIDLLEKNVIDFMKNHPEYTYLGTNVVHGTSLKNVAFNNEKISVILGNEGAGVREEIQSLVDQNIYIPMLDTESLNVGIAGGIIMYKIFEGGK